MSSRAVGRYDLCWLPAKPVRELCQGLFVSALVLTCCRVAEEEAPQEKRRVDAQATAWSKSARVLLEKGRWSEALPLLEKAAPRHAATGERERAVLDLQAAAYTLLYQAHRLDLASAALDAADPYLDPGTEPWGFQPYYRSLIGLASGAPVGALAQLQESRRRLTAHVPERVDAIEDTRAFALQVLGRAEEAERIRYRLAGVTQAGTCERARQLSMSAWGSLLHADDLGAPAPKYAGAWLEQARRIYDAKRCSVAHGADLLALHLSYFELLAGRPKEALSWLERVPLAEISPSERMWASMIDARIALAAGDRDRGLRLAEELAQVARAELDVEIEWRVELLRAEAYAAAGRAVDQRAALERAEVLLFDAMLVVPLGEGRGRFLAERSRGTQRLVDLALSLGDAEGALCALRRARSRLLYRAAQALAIEDLPTEARLQWQRSVQRVQQLQAQIEEAAQSSWNLPKRALGAFRAEQRHRRQQARQILAQALAAVETLPSAPVCDDLRPPAADEVLLAYFKFGSINVGFAARVEEVQVHRFSRSPETVEGWIAPFETALKDADAVRILSGGPTAEVGLHRARFGEGRLGTTRRVTYSLDLPARETRTESAHRALVISDSAANLRGARREGVAVVTVLSDAGWLVTHLSQMEATPARTREALGSATFFHYAGHNESGDRSGWSDRMALWGGALDARQIVALGRVPRWVVLAGCRTAAVRPDATGGVMSIAHGFLLAGADQVVASTDVLDDAAAASVGVALAAATKGQQVDLTLALREAMAEMPESIRNAAATLAVFSR